MLLKGASIFYSTLIFITLCLKIFSGYPKHSNVRPTCHLRRRSCSCLKSFGLELSVSVELCADQGKSACYEKAVSDECRKKAYSLQARRKRSTGSEDFICSSGTIVPSLLSSSQETNSSFKPILKVEINGLSKVVPAGSDVTFRCTVNSSRPANVTWLHDGKPLMKQNHHSYLECRTVLQIGSVLPKDEGIYSCVVKTADGQASAYSKLYIPKKEGPYIVSMGLDDDSKTNTVVTGSNVNLTCKSQDREVQNFFEKDGIYIGEGNGERYTLYYFGDIRNFKFAILEIKNITMDDAGNYTCFANLRGQTVNYTFHLEVVTRNGSSEKVTQNGVSEKDPKPTLYPDGTSSNVFELVFGIIGAVIVAAVALLCFVKRRRWLSSYMRTRRDSTEEADTRSSPEERVDWDPQYKVVVKRPPEVDYEARYDVFICYSYKDVIWVKELLAELEKRHFVCCIDFKDFVPGAAIVENISRAIFYSRKTIAVLSPDFVNSDWCSRELQQALTRIHSHQVVPIVYRECSIPLTLRGKTYLDWESCYVKPYFWEQLENALKRPNDV